MFIISWKSEKVSFENIGIPRDEKTIRRRGFSIKSVLYTIPSFQLRRNWAHKGLGSQS